MPNDDQQPWDSEIERTKSGQPVYRYEPNLNPPDMAFGDDKLIDAISDHISKHLPSAGGSVFHEIVSTTVHVDIHIVPPTDDRPFYVLVTSGMSERAMKAPEGAEGCRYAELVAILPPDWKGLQPTGEDGQSDEAIKDETNYWPLRWLKILARFPHEYDTWIWEGHTMPNGDPAEPFAQNTQMSGMLLDLPYLLPPDFFGLKLEDRTIYFLCLAPLHANEMQYKLDHGAQALSDLFQKHQIHPILIDPSRPSVIDLEASSPAAKKPWWKLW